LDRCNLTTYYAKWFNLSGKIPVHIVKQSNVQDEIHRRESVVESIVVEVPSLTSISEVMKITESFLPQEAMPISKAGIIQESGTKRRKKYDDLKPKAKREIQKEVRILLDRQKERIAESSTQSTELNQSRIIVDSITSEIDGLVDHLIEINSDEDAESSDEELEYSPTDKANICINEKCKKLCTKSDVHLWKGCDNCEAWICGSKSCNKILTMHMRTHTKK